MCMVKVVETQMSKWEEKMRLVEPIVHAKALVEVAERAGVCLEQVAYDPDDLETVSAYNDEWYRIVLNYYMFLSIYQAVEEVETIR